MFFVFSFPIYTRETKKLLAVPAVFLLLLSKAFAWVGRQYTRVLRRAGHGLFFLHLFLAFVTLRKPREEAAAVDLHLSGWLNACKTILIRTKMALMAAH